MAAQLGGAEWLGASHSVAPSSEGMWTRVDIVDQPSLLVCSPLPLRPCSRNTSAAIQTTSTTSTTAISSAARTHGLRSAPDRDGGGGSPVSISRRMSRAAGTSDAATST